MPGPARRAARLLATNRQNMGQGKPPAGAPDHDERFLGGRASSHRLSLLVISLAATALVTIAGANLPGRRHHNRLTLAFAFFPAACLDDSLILAPAVTVATTARLVITRF